MAGLRLREDVAILRAATSFGRIWRPPISPSTSKQNDDARYLY
jgi:hypothetical protein